MQLPDSRCKYVIKLWGLDKAWVKSHWKEFKPVWETLAAVANAVAFECDTASICVENFTNMEDPEDNLSVGEIRRRLDNTVEAIDDFKRWFPSEKKPFSYYKQLAEEYEKTTQEFLFEKFFK